MEYESKEEIRRSVGVGTKHLLHEGATGRAILAFQSQKVQEEIFKNLPIDESEILKDKLIEVKKHGYAVSYEEINDNVTADRKSTRLNSSHVAISYAVFC